MIDSGDWLAIAWSIIIVKWEELGDMSSILIFNIWE